MENKTLGKYVTGKLGIKLVEYCELEGIAPRTLALRWNSEIGQTHTVNRVFRLWMEARYPAGVKKFDDL